MLPTCVVLLFFKMAVNNTRRRNSNIKIKKNASKKEHLNNERYCCKNGKETRTAAGPGPPPISLGTSVKAFLSARFCAAIWSHITDCDETFNYWEPSHFLMYMKGLQTWEYSPEYGLRSYTYLLLHLVPALIYDHILQPSRIVIFYFMRCILGLMCAACESYFYVSVCKEFGPQVGRLVLIFMVFSPGMFISSTAFLPSSFSMYMVMLSQGAWYSRQYELAVFTTALSTFISWPFSALIGVFIAADMLFLRKNRATFFKWSIFSTFFILAPMTKIDSDLFGKLVIAPLNIVIYNVFTKHGPNLYGTEPASFYFVNGFLNFNIIFLFAISAPLLVFLKLKVTGSKMNIPLRFWMFMAPFFIWVLVFTAQPHKEERFLFPIYPLICLCGGIAVSSLQAVCSALLPRAWPSSSHVVTAAVVLFSALLGISRVFALFRGYHAPMDVYLELHKLHTEGIVPEGVPMNVCVGKEWHRFPSSFFLPADNWNLRFIESEFRGQLPAQYTASPEGAALIHDHFNDQNKEQRDRYWDVKKCHFLVDLDTGGRSEREPNYSHQTDKWLVRFSRQFLLNEQSHKFFRAFYIPFLSDQYCTYGSYNLLQSTRLILRENLPASDAASRAEETSLGRNRPSGNGDRRRSSSEGRQGRSEPSTSSSVRKTRTHPPPSDGAVRDRSPDRRTKRPDEPGTSRGKPRRDKPLEKGASSRHTTSKKEAKGRWSASFAFPLPKLGEPGGRDDPLRRGLNGTACKRYINLLHEGHEPTAARELALKKPDPTVAGSSTSKRNSDNITSPQAPAPKKVRTHTPVAVASRSFASVAKNIRIAVLAKDHQSKPLTSEQLTDIQSGLMKDLADGKGDDNPEAGIQFSGITFKSGWLVFGCENEFTANWVKTNAPSITGWKGPELVTCPEEEVPRGHTIVVFLPRSADTMPAAALNMLKRQNFGCRADSWKVIRTKLEGQGILLVAEIDDLAKDYILQHKSTLFYRYGIVAVTGLNKKKPVDSEMEIVEAEEPAKTQALSSEAGSLASLYDRLNVLPSTSGVLPPIAEATAESKAVTADLAVDSPLTMKLIGTADEAVASDVSGSILTEGPSNDDH